MAEENSKDAHKQMMPPYTAFASTKSALQVLHDHVIPNRIDRSVWGNKFSGAVATQVLTALRFLKLIQQDGTPTEKMRPLVEALGAEQWPVELRRVIESAYAPIFELDLEKATASEFYERFRRVYNAEGETGRKCVTFFLNAAREAAIPVSPFLLANAKPRAASAPRRKPRKFIPTVAPEDVFGPRPSERRAMDTDGGASLTERLLDKFPEFDPKWPDDIKAKWFSNFSELMDRTKA